MSRPSISAFGWGRSVRVPRHVRRLPAGNPDAISPVLYDQDLEDVFDAEARRREARDSNDTAGSSSAISLTQITGAATVLLVAVIGFFRLLEWSGSAGTWWAVILLYVIAGVAGGLIAWIARPVELEDEPT